jgi:hypothetical protein
MTAMETLLLIEREGPPATAADRIVRAFRGYQATVGDESPLSLIRRAAWMAELREAMATYGHVACVDGVGLMQQGNGECPEVIITVPSVCYQRIPIAHRVNDLGLKRPAKTWRFPG